MKKLAIVLTAAMWGAPVSAVSAVVGDINGDGKINLSEAIYALRVSAGLSPQPFSTVISGCQIWMDRNLGASQVATSPTDSVAYGDLYQWGRLADGHESRSSPNTSILSPTEVPGHDSFILADDSPNDWTTQQNDTLWQGVSGTNNPCPAGFRLPTYTELDTELTQWGFKDLTGAFASPLKLVVGGCRDYSDGAPCSFDVATQGNYWSSTVSGSGGSILYFSSDEAMMYAGDPRAYGFSVRCIKD